MKKHALYIIIISSLFSCSNTNTLEDQFITNNDECWVIYNQSQDGYVYYKFNSDKTSDNMTRDKDGNFKKFNIDGDLVIGPKKWSVSNDSILSWGFHKYDIVNSNDNVIVIMCEDSKTHNQEHMFFIKENKKTQRKGASYFEEKRLKKPKKYISVY